MAIPIQENIIPDDYKPKMYKYSKAKTIKLVTKVETVECAILDKLSTVYPYYSQSFDIGEHELGIASDGSDASKIDFKTTYDLLPIHKVITGYETTKEVVNDEYYIAYTPEIEKLFRLPYKTMKAEISSLSYDILELQGTLELTEKQRDFYQVKINELFAKVKSYKSSFWKRFKFLFKGEF